MTDSMKCCFCGAELKNACAQVIYYCPTGECKAKDWYASKQVWQALIQAKQDLEQSEKCCSAWETQALDYKAETIALSGKLEIAKSYVKGISKMVINSGDNIYIVIGHFKKLAEQTLEQIEHKDE